MGKRETNELMVGLDVGTSKVAAVVGEFDETGLLTVRGYGSAPSQGLKRGVVMNIDATVQSIRQAVEAAEVMAGCQINCAFTGIADSNVQSVNSQGMVAIRDNEVTYQDISRVIDAARTVAIPADQQVMHILPQEFIIDKQGSIREPLGMSGVRLEAKIHMITGASSAMQNVAKCVKRCGLQVSDIVLDQLASSYAVLSEEEKELGVCLIDIGAGTTDIIVISRGAIRYTAVLPIAGDQVSNDLAIALRMPTQTAEAIKTTHGSALLGLSDPHHAVEVPAVGNCPAQTFTQQQLAEVIGPRYEEIFELVKAELKKHQCERAIGAGFVLTGGASLMPGALEIAQHIFHQQVRMGLPQGVTGASEAVTNPIYATSVGLLMYAGQQQHEQQHVRVSNDSVGSVWTRIKNWFQGNF